MAAPISGLLPTFSIFLALIGAVHAQTIAVVPRFVEGERVDLLVETSRKDQRVDHSSRTAVTVTVQSASEEGAVLIWESGETELENVPPEALALMQSMSAAVQGLQLDCEFNSLGEFTGLRNEAEVIEKMQLGIDAMTRTMLAQIPDPQTQERVRLALEQVLQPATILATTTKNVGLYAGAAQMELDVEEPVSIETEAETPLGVVQSRVTVTASDYDSDANTATIHVVSKPTPESFRALSNALLRRMLQTDEAEKLAEAMKDFSFELRDETTYEIDLSRGWPTTVNFSRVLNVQESQRLDQTRITLQRINTP